MALPTVFEQVHRHFRRHRDTWGLVAKHLNESGNGWDDNTKTLILSQSTLNGLSANDRGILTKPIQFFDKLQELFSGSTADGSFMQDACTAAELDNDGFDKFAMMNDMPGYDETKVPQGEDSDKLESDSDDCQEVAAVAATSSQVSSSNIGTLKPNMKSFKRVGKKTVPAAHSNKASKSRPSSVVHDNNETDVLLTTTLVGIKDTLAKPIQTVAPPDPNGPLWEMLKTIALPPDDKMAVGMYLCKPEFQIHRSFLISMGQEYLERWVYKHLSGGDLATSDLTSEY
ncbi:hypothetical protein ACP70R_046214 [Stipagrostis hirtigluma subsp. patula]